MYPIKKLSAVASLAAPILIGGAAGVAAAELPVATAPADTVTAAAASRGSATALPESLGSGGHQDPPGVNVGRQSSDRE